jgi:hypothetical protein
MDAAFFQGSESEAARLEPEKRNMRLNWTRWSTEQLRKFVGNSPRHPDTYGTMPREELEAFLSSHLDEPAYAGQPREISG